MYIISFHLMLRCDANDHKAWILELEHRTLCCVQHWSPVVIKWLCCFIWTQCGHEHHVWSHINSYTKVITNTLWQFHIKYGNINIFKIFRSLSILQISFFKKIWLLLFLHLLMITSYPIKLQWKCSLRSQMQPYEDINKYTKQINTPQGWSGLHFVFLACPVVNNSSLYHQDSAQFPTPSLISIQSWIVFCWSLAGSDCEVQVCLALYVCKISY